MCLSSKEFFKTWSAFFRDVSDSPSIKTLCDTYKGAGFVYVLQSLCWPDNVYKIGETCQLHRRMSCHNSNDPLGQIYLKVWIVDRRKIIEQSIFHALSSYKFNEKREFFQVDIAVLVQTIEGILEKKQSLCAWTGLDVWGLKPSNADPDQRRDSLLSSPLQIDNCVFDIPVLPRPETSASVSASVLLDQLDIHLKEKSGDDFLQVDPVPSRRGPRGVCWDRMKKGYRAFHSRGQVTNSKLFPISLHGKENAFKLAVDQRQKWESEDKEYRHVKRRFVDITEEQYEHQSHLGLDCAIFFQTKECKETHCHDVEPIRGPCLRPRTGLRWHENSKKCGYGVVHKDKTNCFYIKKKDKDKWRIVLEKAIQWKMDQRKMKFPPMTAERILPSLCGDKT